MLLPVLVFTTGIALPAGWITEGELIALVRNPWTRVVCAGLVLLFLFHWAHRFRYALVDLGFKRIGRQAWLFYGIATAGGLLGVVAALRL
jgi:fumarate reductase subunit D